MRKIALLIVALLLIAASTASANHTNKESRISKIPPHSTKAYTCQIEDVYHSASGGFLWVRKHGRRRDLFVTKISHPHRDSHRDVWRGARSKAIVYSSGDEKYRVIVNTSSRTMRYQDPCPPRPEWDDPRD